MKLERPQPRPTDTDFFSDTSLEIVASPIQGDSPAVLAINALKSITDGSPSKYIRTLIENRVPGCIDESNDAHATVIEELAEEGKPIPEVCRRAPVPIKPTII